MEFQDFRRKDGSVGTRNYIGILSTVVCANEVADGISMQINGTAAFTHQQGCAQTPMDIIRVNALLPRQEPHRYRPSMSTGLPPR